MSPCCSVCCCQQYGAEPEHLAQWMAIAILILKEGNVQGLPKGSTIHAAINGHLLMVTFTENLGQVAVEVTTATGSPVDATLTITPNGVQFYIPRAGDYIVTFTLPNGDE